MDKALWELSQYRMDQAKRCIRTAKVLAEDEDYKGAANRSYFSEGGLEHFVQKQRQDFLQLLQNSVNTHIN